VLTCSSNLRSQPVANSGCIPARPHRPCIFGGGGRPHGPTAATGAVGPASPARWGRGKERSAGRLRPQSLGVSVCPTGELRWRHLPPLCVQRRCGHVAGARARSGLAAGTHHADGGEEAALPLGTGALVGCNGQGRCDHSVRMLRQATQWTVSYFGTALE